MEKRGSAATLAAASRAPALSETIAAASVRGGWLARLRDSMSPPHFRQPIFILGCNRSGTSLMFQNLSAHPRVWSIYEEAQRTFYRHYPLDPEVGDRIAEPPAATVAADVQRELFRLANNKELFGERWIGRVVPRKLMQRQVTAMLKRPPIRFVEKTPANTLRVPFLAKLFPDARFVYLIRRAEDVISSLMEGWKNWSSTGDGEWSFGDWHYLAPPGWRRWTDKSLQEICAFQWIESNRIAWQDLNECAANRFLLVRHEDALADPRSVYANLFDFCELSHSAFLERRMAENASRTFTHGGSAPRPNKWRLLHEPEVESVRPLFQPLVDEFYPGPVVSPP